MTTARSVLSARPLRCATAGSVDDGKSTLIGRLLHDAKALLSDQLAQVAEASKRRGHVRTDLALLTDGLRAEREQGITIDVAWRYFSTPRRRFVLADAPGHVQYTRNMVTAASVADVVIILVDARHGLTEQTRRHLFVARLLGVDVIAVAINKMDQVGYARDVFTRIREEVTSYVKSLAVPGHKPTLEFFPISALVGDNVVEASREMPWYDGVPLLYYLESLAVNAKAEPARFAVQWVIRPQSAEHPDYRGYAGRVSSGALHVGQDVTVWPGERVTKLTRIESAGVSREEAVAGDSVTLHLADDLDVSRGSLLAIRGESEPAVTSELSADVAWVSDRRGKVGDKLLVKHLTREVRAIITSIDARYDLATGDRVSVPEGIETALGTNDLASVRLRLAEEIAVDRYADLKRSGNFLLVDAASGETLAGGMIR